MGPSIMEESGCPGSMGLSLAPIVEPCGSRFQPPPMIIAVAYLSNGLAPVFPVDVRRPLGLPGAFCAKGTIESESMRRVPDQDHSSAVERQNLTFFKSSQHVRMHTLVTIAKIESYMTSRR